MIGYGYERLFWRQGRQLVAGVDEAGRGPLAGPVVAAAVVFEPEVWIHGVDDSKKLSAGEREALYELITRGARSVGVGIVPHAVIDEINIYRATLQAMALAVGQLAPPPQHLLVDGPHFGESAIPYTTLVDGDALCFSIAAASIVAKVTRDRLMLEYDLQYPLYGFAQHKGYGTPRHLEALRRYGPCAIHRRSFRMPARGRPSGPDG
jgi:ribonuclease HII